MVDSSQRSSFGAAAYYRYPTQLTTLTGTLKDYFEANKVEGAPIALAEYWLTKIGTDFRYQKGVTTTVTAAHEAWESAPEFVRISRTFFLLSYELRTLFVATLPD